MFIMTCKECHGAGYDKDTNRVCWVCHGNGKVVVFAPPDTVKIKEEK